MSVEVERVHPNVQQASGKGSQRSDAVAKAVGAPGPSVCVCVLPGGRHLLQHHHTAYLVLVMPAAAAAAAAVLLNVRCCCCSLLLLLYRRAVSCGCTCHTPGVTAEWLQGTRQTSLEAHVLWTVRVAPTPTWTSPTARLSCTLMCCCQVCVAASCNCSVL